MHPIVDMSELARKSLLSEIHWLHNTPAPNQMEVFQALADAGPMSLTVYNCNDSFPARSFAMGSPWIAGRLSFRHHILRGFHGRLGKYREFYFNPGIVTAIVRSPRSSLWIVGGYTIPTALLAMWLLTLLGRRWILINEPPKRGGKLRECVRQILLLPVRFGAKGVLVYGSRARAHYFDRYLSEEKVVALPQCQNLDPLLRLERAFGSPDSTPGRVRFLYAGQIEPFSGVRTLVRAFNLLCKITEDAELLILGGGSCRAEVEGMVGASARQRVRFLGVIDRQMIPSAYRDADVFVHASIGQGWGMVVNEALAAGLPVISSRSVGAAEELITDGWNGFLVSDPTDQCGFAEKMLFFAQNREQIPGFSANARKTAGRVTLEAGVRDFWNAVGHLLR